MSLIFPFPTLENLLLDIEMVLSNVNEIMTMRFSNLRLRNADRNTDRYGDVEMVLSNVNVIMTMRFSTLRLRNALAHVQILGV